MKRNRDSLVKFFFTHNALQKFMALLCTLVVFLTALHNELSEKAAADEQAKRETEAAALASPADAVEKEVDVALAVDGALPEGFRITSFETLPGRVVIAGSPARLEEVESISTKAVDLSGITQSVKINVELEVPEFIRVKDNLSVVVASINIAKVESLDAELPENPEAEGDKEKTKPAEQGK